VTHFDDLAPRRTSTNDAGVLRPFLVVLLASLSFACSKDPASTDAMRGGVPDDSVKPAMAPTGTVARVGVADDGVKPIAKPAPTPTIAPVVKPVLTPAPVTTPK